MIFSDRLQGHDREPSHGDGAVFKTATVPVAVQVQSLGGAVPLCVQFGSVSVLVTLTPDEARHVAERLETAAADASRTSHRGLKTNEFVYCGRGQAS